MSSTAALTELSFEGAQSIPIDDQTNVPTCIYYSPKGPRIGIEAHAAVPLPHELNQDFKMDLGLHAPERQTGKSHFDCADGQRRTAGTLANDFIHILLKKVDNWLQRNNLEREPFILVAEPVALEASSVSKEWGENYRNYLRRILRGKGFRDIDFCPEPFAVYNYYRYEKRVPVLAEKGRQRVLVLDFGAGTLDASIIESTLAGDLARGGEKARPYAVSSDAAGGYLFNRLIAESKYRSVYPKGDRANIGKGIDLYNRWRREGDSVLTTAAEAYRTFCHNFHNTIYQIESAKISLCNANLDWDPESKFSASSVEIVLPDNPFAEMTRRVPVPLSIADLRECFVKTLWHQRLRPLVQRCIQRGRAELRGEPLTVVLLSGGSSNIRWFRYLIEREFEPDLLGAQIVPIHDYQEVVSKGLAIECARRFFGKQKDFCRVTYNPLYLFLDSDRTGLQAKRFIPKDANLPKPDSPGLLLPAATPVTLEREATLRWKVRLDRPPRHRLDYFFCRSVEESDDPTNALNLGASVATTPPNCAFDQQIQVELRNVGKASVRPRFYYRSRATEVESVFVEGDPFYLDLTTEEASSRAAYIGFDFGTCNSSLAYVDDRQIRQSTVRATGSNWQDLRQLRDSLPFPIAEPLVRYLSEMDEDRRLEVAREVLEGALAISAYAVYFDFCASKNTKTTTRIKDMRQRSAGPLWKLLRETVQSLGSRAGFTREFNLILKDEFFRSVDEFVTFAAKQKHQKGGAFDADHPLRVVTNVCHRVFSNCILGYFISVEAAARSKGKRYRGIFRIAHGRPPFSRYLKYSGTESFARDQLFLLNLENKRLLPLWPLAFWADCPQHPTADYNCGHLFLFDKYEDRSKAFSFKAVGYPCDFEIHSTGEDSELFNDLRALQTADPEVEVLEPGNFEHPDD